MQKLKEETVFCLALIIIFSYLYSVSLKMPPGMAARADVGTGFFPRAMCLLIIIPSFLLVIKNITLLLKSGSLEEFNNKNKLNNKVYKGFLAALGNLIIIIVYVLIMPNIGFVISTFLFLAFLNFFLYRLKYKKFMPLITLGKSIVFSYFFSYFLNLVMVNYFNIYLP